MHNTHCIATCISHPFFVILGRVTIEGGRDDDEEDSHSHRHGEKSNKNDNEDSRSGTGGTNTPDVVIDLSPCEYVRHYECS